MSWKAEVKAEGKWIPNGLVFKTKVEATGYGKEVMRRWSQATEARAVESDLLPNYEYKKGELKIVGMKDDKKF